MYMLFLILILCIVGLVPFLNKIDSKSFLLGGLILFLIMGLYITFNADTYLRPADPKYVLDAANNINNGNYTDLEKSAYLGEYPFQLGLVSFERVLLKFSTNIAFFYFINLVFTMIIMVYFWKISKSIVAKNSVQNIVVILFILFLPHLFNILFVYGNVLGYMFLVLAVYFHLKTLQVGNLKNYLLVIIFGALAYIVKNNFEIGIIAMICVYLTRSLSNHKLFLMAMTLFLVIPVSNQILSSYYTKITHSKIAMNQGIPKNSFIVMGLQESGNKAGWYSSYTNKNYKKSGYNTAEAKKMAKKDLEKRLYFFKTHPEDFIKFLNKKYSSTWGDSMYQSVWIGPLATWGGKLKTRVFRAIYAKNGNSKTYYVLSQLSRLVNWLIMSMSIIFVTFNVILKKRAINNYVLFALVFATGGFLFHTIWETKSQYVWQYVSMLIPLASLGITRTSDFFYKKLAKRIRA